jgi:hypothetical protein
MTGIGNLFLMVWAFSFRKSMQSHHGNTAAGAGNSNLAVATDWVKEWKEVGQIIRRVATEVQNLPHFTN